MCECVISECECEWGYELEYDDEVVPSWAFFVFWKSDMVWNEALSFEIAWVALNVSMFLSSFIEWNGLGGGERFQKLYGDKNGVIWC